MHHSCGSIYEIIPDLIELGADAIHPIQALAANMEAERMADEFGDRVSFVGGVDVQDLMVHGSPQDVGERFDADMAKMAADPETQSWWDTVKPLQEPVDDRKDGEWWHDLVEVFHQD